MITDFLKVRFLGKRIPVAVRWDLTARCPWRCRYCQIWKLQIGELETEQIFKVIREMRAAGVVKISFSGGEPLLREDIAEIVQYTKERKISPEMNTTGFLFVQKAPGLKSLDLLKISLDGPPAVNDLVRGKEGAHECAIEAAKAAREHGIRFIFTCTLTGYNLQDIDYLLDTAQRFSTMVAFQPLKDIRYLKHSTSYEEDDTRLFPQSQAWQEALDRIIAFKKKHSGLIRNTLRELDHIYEWPKYERLTCWGGRLFCMVNPAGDVSPCDRLYYKEQLPNCLSESFPRALEHLPPLPPCNGCGFCGTLELNYSMNFKWDVIRSIITKRL